MLEKIQHLAKTWWLFTGVSFLLCSNTVGATVEFSGPAKSIRQVFEREKAGDSGPIPIVMSVVINLFDPTEGVCYAADGDDTFFLSLPEDFYTERRLATGQRIEIEGNYDLGLHVVRVLKFKLLEESVALATPKQIDFSTLIMGASWCDRVSVSGKVAEVCVSEQQSWLVLENPEYLVRVLVAQPFGKTQGQQLLGSEVQAYGVMDYQTGPDGNPNAVLVRVDSGSDLQELEKGNLQLARLPLVSPADLLEIESNSWFKVQGQSTYSTREFLFLEGENKKLIFNGQCCDEIYRDAVVEIIGRRTNKDSFEIGCVHQGSMVRPSAPLHLSLHALKGVATPDRYRVSGRIEAIASSGEERSVIISDSGKEIALLFPADDEQWKQLALQKGMTVSAPGLLLDSVNAPLELLVTEAEAIEIQVDWLTENSPAIKNFAFIALFLLLLAGLWVFFLRRQVRMKTTHLNQLTAVLDASHEAIKEGIAIISPEGDVLKLSSLFRNIVGLGEQPIIDAKDLFLQLKSRIVEAEAFDSMTFGLLDDHSTTRTAEFQISGTTATNIVLHTAPVISSQRNSEVIARIWAVEDTSSRKELEASLVQSRKMEAIGRFAGGIAHDFNNLLMTISGNIELARDEDSEFQPAGAGSHLEAAEHAADQASQLVHQLLHFSKETPLQAELVNLNEIVSSLQPLLKSMLPSSIELEMRPCSELRACMVNVTQIHRVILNLCMNARDAIQQEAGKIVIETSNIDCDSKDFVQLSVIDNGCGIAPEVIDQIFEPLFSTKAEGRNCGLGLSICYTIAKQHSGAIACSSKLEDGSRFDFKLPCHDTNSSASPKTQNVEPLPHAANKSVDSNEVAELRDAHPHSSITRDQ